MAHSADLSVQTIARLIEERVWCANEDLDQFGDSLKNPSADLQWLHENVFPTLVPALGRMLELASEHMKKSNQDSVVVPGRSEKVPNYGPTGLAHPITWLAEFLLRNNPAHGSSFLNNHPYVLVERAKVQQQAKEDGQS